MTNEMAHCGLLIARVAALHPLAKQSQARVKAVGDLVVAGKLNDIFLNQSSVFVFRFKNQLHQKIIHFFSVKNISDILVRPGQVLALPSDLIVDRLDQLAHVLLKKLVFGTTTS